MFIKHLLYFVTVFWYYSYFESFMRNDKRNIAMLCCFYMYHWMRKTQDSFFLNIYPRYNPIPSKHVPAYLWDFLQRYLAICSSNL